MKTLKEIEHDAIVERLRRFGGCKDKAAASLKISRSKVYRFCVEHPNLDLECKERRDYGLKAEDITLPVGHR